MRINSAISANVQVQPLNENNEMSRNATLVSPQTSLWATHPTTATTLQTTQNDAMDQRCMPMAGLSKAGISPHRMMMEVLKLLLGFLQRILGMLSRTPQAAGEQRPIAGHNAPGNSENGKSGVKVDGPNGFLWKPTSDSDGKLAILTPKELTGKIADVVVKDANGKVLERGRMTGVGNGDREHFRFSRSGATFPPGVTVEVRLKGGGVRNYPIANPAERYD